MKKILKSKAMAWIVMLLVVVVIGITFRFRTHWWAFIDIFMAFMMCFCHLASLYLQKMSRIASAKMENAAFIFGLLTVISFLVEFFVLHYCG